MLTVAALALAAGLSTAPQAGLAPTQAAPFVVLEQTPEVQVPRVEPRAYAPVRFDEAAFRAELAPAPMEFTAAATDAPLLIDLPHPDGSTRTVRVAETQVLHPDLAARFPEIKTYRLYGVDEPGATGRITVTPQATSVFVRSPQGSWFVDRLDDMADDVYGAFLWKDAGITREWVCTAGHDHAIDPGMMQLVPEVQARIAGQIRTLRAAFAATGEFTQANGGTVAAGLAAVAATINGVNANIEPDFGARLQLVANNDAIIFTNPATDGYSNFNNGQLLGQNQAKLDSVIGNANYDIGHVLNTAGGGVVASLGSICSPTLKGRGVSGTFSGIPNAALIDVTSHEVGHQFGAGHTWNGVNGGCSSQQWSSVDAFEPGSGSTIMSYAGICGSDNVASTGLPQYHSKSIASADLVLGILPNCGTVTSTGNSPPSVTIPGATTIPASQPFELTAVGTDPDGDTLTYSWEQRDRGPQASLFAADDGQIPLFEVRADTTNPTRVFPRPAVLRGVNDPGERLPSVPRSMSMRVQVRDGQGNTATERVIISVVNSVGPLGVITPLSTQSFTGPFDISWFVGGTDGPPTNAETVDIYLSTDNADSFPILLAAGEPNDGFATVTPPPGINTTTARVKLKASNSIWFAINPGAFTLNTPDSQGCNGADIAPPFGQLTFADISAFLGAFSASDPAADLAAPTGAFTFADISAFLALFSSGCP